MEKRNVDWGREIKEITQEFAEFIDNEKKFFDSVAVIYDRKTALRFLKRHKIVPSELELTEDDYNHYCDVIKYFSENMYDESIPLMIFSIRKWSSLPVAQGFAFALKNQNKSIVDKAIKDALLSKYRDIKETGLFFAIELPSKSFIEPLAHILKENSLGDEILMDAIDALEAIMEEFNATQIAKTLENAYKKNMRLARLIKEKNYVEKVKKEVDCKFDIVKADSAFMEKNYIKVIELLEQYNGCLPNITQKKYDISKKKIKNKK